MNNQKILDNAPEGATHVDNEGDYWLMHPDNATETFMDGEWVYCNMQEPIRSLADIKRITELEKELATSKPPPNLIWFDRSEVLGLDPEQTGVIDLRGMKLEQQAKGLTDYAKEQEQGLNAVWMIAAASKLNEQAKALQEQG